MRERIREVRKSLHYTQGDFGKKLGVGRDVIVNIELGRADPKPLFIEHLCTVFNVSEKWLSSGTGEMFIKPERISLDKYAKERGLTALESDVIRCYMDLDPEIRKMVMNHFKEAFLRHTAEASDGLDIDREVEDYRHELQQEKSIQTSSVLPNTDAKIV